MEETMFILESMPKSWSFMKCSVNCKHYCICSFSLIWMLTSQLLLCWICLGLFLLFSLLFSSFFFHSQKDDERLSLISLGLDRITQPFRKSGLSYCHCKLVHFSSLPSVPKNLPAFPGGLSVFAFSIFTLATLATQHAKGEDFLFLLLLHSENQELQYSTPVLSLQ